MSGSGGLPALNSTIHRALRAPSRARPIVRSCIGIFYRKKPPRNAARNGSIDFYGNRGGPDNRTGANTTKRALPSLLAVAGGPFFAFVHYKEADVTAHLVAPAEVDRLIAAGEFPTLQHVAVWLQAKAAGLV